MKTEQKYFDLLILITKNEELSTLLAKEMMESENNLYSFFDKHKAAHFTNRGIGSADHPELALCYLLDKLEESEFLYELDYKPDSEELNYSLKLLSKGIIKNDLFSEEDEQDAHGMFELIFDAEDILEEFDLGIVQFPIESDSHPISLVPLEKLEVVQTLIDELFG
jgi:hypothetical protein